MGRRACGGRGCFAMRRGACWRCWPLASLYWSVIPLLVVLALESWYAFHRDWKFLGRFGAKAVLARFVFSVAVPWVVAANQIYGLFSTKPQTNVQNEQGREQGQGTGISKQVPGR